MAEALLVAKAEYIEITQLEKTMKMRSGIGFLVAALIGLVVGILIGWAVGLATGSRTQVVEGYAYVNETGTAIGLSPDGEAPGTGYVVAGALWREEDGPWHDTFPTCLEPLVADQRARLGVMQARLQGDAPGRPIVVWLECLGSEMQDASNRSANDAELAQGVLIEFFKYLNDGDYLSASSLYGGSYEVLAEYNPELDLEYSAALLRNACTINGFQCLQVQSVTLQQGGAHTGEYRFVVEFLAPDGGRFILDPCCGSTETDMAPRSQFEFTVVHIGEGTYQVQDLPIYAP
jgi:hypothetical protein